MAGLSVLTGQTELDEVIACFHKCKENLEAPPMELLQPGMEILNNNGTLYYDDSIRVHMQVYVLTKDNKSSHNPASVRPSPAHIHAPTNSLLLYSC